MKKLLIACWAILILLSGAGCRPKKVYKIGISQCSSDDWREKMNEEVMLEAMIHDDVLVEIRSADADSRKQVADLEYFAANGFDVIMVAPNEAETLTPEVRKLHNAGIPIVIFDRNISDSSYTQRIGVDNINLGHSAGRYAINMLPEGVRAIEIYGLPGSTPAIDRNIGFRQVIEEEGGTLLASVPGDWEEEKAEIAADSLLRLYKDANLIFAHNDRMAIGARKAAEKAARRNIRIIGIDAAPKIGIQAVSDGLIDATFLYPTEGERLLREAIAIAKGEEFSREVMLPTTSAVDSTNADILLLQNNAIEEENSKVVALKDRLDNYVSLHNAQTALVYAIIAILILLFGVLFLVLRTFWSNRRHQETLLNQNRMLQEERDKQKELNERLEEATQSKLNFFTNVSHDLRTPLTLIAEPVAQLNGSANLDSQQKTLMQIAHKNVKILQRLINQILDFRKFENNKLDIILSEVDFSQAIRDWMESFYAIARKRDIKLELKEPEQPVSIAIDAEKMERVFFNLLSNAMKYSPDNSEITVSYHVEGNAEGTGDDAKLVLKVADTGEGISAENIKHIFDSFFQVDRVRPRGSGIGLSLAKAFVELHGGTISVESEVKKGSVFTVVLPLRHVATEAAPPVKNITQEDVDSELETVETDKTFDDDKPLLLVIDDNKDIREMVTELMKDEYNVLTAPNGKEGIRKASKYVPDLIVCDVMMPGIDGMEVCQRLKSETITSHVPVLMLTACSLDEQRVQGFDSGADGYLAKPFSSAVLKAHSKSLIANRRRIKDVMQETHVVTKGVTSGTTSGTPDSSKPGSEKPSAQKTSGTKPTAPVAAPYDSDIENDFFNKFLLVFENRMGDPDLNVEAIASDLGFERTQLYRKIKAITNYSPVELIRNLRLKKARALLKTTDKTISEICYEVGFSTPAYFSKCYREQFGETPSETRNQI